VVDEIVHYNILTKQIKVLMFLNWKCVIFPATAPVWQRSMVISDYVCLSVCLYVCLFVKIFVKSQVLTSPNFLCILSIALRYVMYFRFCGRRQILPPTWIWRHVANAAASLTGEREEGTKVCRYNWHSSCFLVLAISKAKTLMHFSNKTHGSNFTEHYSESVTVWDQQNADCSLKK